MPLTPAVSKTDHIQGNKQAVIELVEYGDYQCPYCGLAYPIVKRIQEDLGHSLKFVFRNFPLRKIHPQAMGAAIASEAAAIQGKFWEMHDTLFENQSRLNPNSIIAYAKELGLDSEQFKEDIISAQLEDKVLSDFKSGLWSGVNATPTFFINGIKYEGDWGSEAFLAFLRNII